MKALITGGAGFIGSHLTDSLLARGWTVTAVDDLSKGRRENIEHILGRDDYEFVVGDCRELVRMLEVGDGADVVVNLAATKIPRYGSALGNLTINLQANRTALEVAHRNKAKFVLASTSDVYGKNPDLPFREDGDSLIGPSTTPRWAYGVTKLCDEHMAFAYQDEYELPVTVLRYFGSYGERQYLNWWGGPQGVFLEALAKGEPLQVHGDGAQTRCFTHVDDMVEATSRAIERPEANGEIINVGSDHEVTINELAELMYRVSGAEGDPRITYVPYESFSRGYQDVLRRVPALDKQRAILEFEPRIGLEEGTRRLWSWYSELDRSDRNVPA
ncbi:MAG: NAD-dependent epimerase/dehydratase family protein [Solirubrobacterales bacterium]